MLGIANEIILVGGAPFVVLLLAILWRKVCSFSTFIYNIYIAAIYNLQLPYSSNSSILTFFPRQSTLKKV